MKAQRSRSVSFHARAADFQAIDDVAIPCRFHGRAAAFPARAFDAPTIGVAGFLPVDVASAALPSIDDAAILDRFHVHADSEPAGVVDLPDGASGLGPDPAVRVALANVVPEAGALGNPSIPDGFAWDLLSKRLRRYKRRHRIVGDRSERNTLIFSAHLFSFIIPPLFSCPFFGFIMTDGQLLFLIIEGKRYEMMSNL